MQLVVLVFYGCCQVPCSHDCCVSNASFHCTVDGSCLLLRRAAILHRKANSNSIRPALLLHVIMIAVNVQAIERLVSFVVRARPQARVLAIRPLAIPNHSPPRTQTCPSCCGRSGRTTRTLCPPPNQTTPNQPCTNSGTPHVTHCSCHPYTAVHANTTAAQTLLLPPRLLHLLLARACQR